MTDQEARDERERVELAGIIHRAVPAEFDQDPLDFLCGDDSCLWYDIADALLAAGYRKSPEPEWEYGVGWVYQDNFITGFPMDSLEEAQAHVARYPEDEGTRLENFVVLRRPERYSGPWEPVGEKEQA